MVTYKMTDSTAIPDAESEPLLSEASRALFQLGRTFSKIPQRQSGSQGTTQIAELSQILVVQAVETATKLRQSATVAAVAEALLIEPSTASRLVAQTIRAGYLARTVSPHDGRAAQLTLTVAGQALADHARHYQRTVFDQVTQDWSDAERQTFARLFVKFAQAVDVALRAKVEESPADSDA